MSSANRGNINDYERFSRHMERTLQLLRDSIQKLDVPLVQKDKLSGLVRQLREYSYQAGRAKAFSRTPGDKAH